MKAKFLSLFFLAALLALFAGCESDDDYYGSGSVNVYGGVGYSSGFYDPWYGGYYGGGGAIIVNPPNRPQVNPLPASRGGGRIR